MPSSGQMGHRSGETSSGTNFGGVGSSSTFGGKLFGPTSFLGKLFGSILGTDVAQPSLSRNNATQDVKNLMDYHRKKKGIAGQMAPTKLGTATDMALSMLHPTDPFIGPMVQPMVDVVRNYQEDEKAVRAQLKDIYGAAEIDQALSAYQASVIEGAKGIDSPGGRHGGEFDLELRKQPPEEPAAGKNLASSTPNVEAMRAPRKKTKRIFAGNLGSTGRGGVRRAKLLGH